MNTLLCKSIQTKHSDMSVEETFNRIEKALRCEVTPLGEGNEDEFDANTLSDNCPDGVEFSLIDPLER
jgi:hypothetical protein